MARSNTTPRPRGSDRVFAASVTGSGGSGGRNGLLAYLLWIAQAGAWVFLLAAMVSFSPADWPSHAAFPHNQPAANWCGPLGAWPAYHLLNLLGIGAWVLMLLWGLHLFLSAFVTRPNHLGLRAIGAIIMAGAVSTIQGLLWPAAGALPDLGGGVVGTVAAAELAVRFSTFGSMLLLTLTFLVGATVALDVWVILGPMWAYKKAKVAAPPVAKATTVAAGHTVTIGKRIGTIVYGLLGIGEKERKAARVAKGTPATDAVAKPTAETELKPGAIDENAGGLGGTVPFDPDAHAVTAETTDAEDEEDDADASEVEAEVAAAGATADDTAKAAETGPAPRIFTPEELRAKIAKLPLRFASTDRKTATEADLRDIQNVAELEGYKFPGLDLLEEPELNYPEKLEAFVREQATALERALKEYKIDGEVVSIDSGPVITLYEIRLAPGTKVSALSAISSDLARALKAINIRIVPNQAGRDTVGVEVPNPHKEKVRLKELMGKSDYWAGMHLPMFLGKDASGAPLIADLTQMPHMLIAGTTGSGKSVSMASILMSFLYTKKPNELKLVLVDPKMVELSQFKDVPHLMCPVVTETAKAAAILEWATRKMDERYELLVEAGCRDIQGYNSLTWEELKERFNPADEAEEARIPKKLPFMVFVIDELADLIMTAKEVEHSIVRIAQKARAVGIHLIVATQRPQANVVTGLIKSNMPARVCFKVASGMDSRIVMDQKGGELLLGQGDMLYLSPRSSKLTRAQGTLVDDREIRRVVAFMKTVAEPSFERSLMQIKTGAAAAGELGGDSGETESDGVHDGYVTAQSDELFEKAVEIVMETKIGSVSMLQRRLAIGYTRSARLIELMGHAGILGAHKGTQARELLITPDEWQAMKAQAAADAEAGSSGDAPADAPDPAQPTLFAADPPKPASPVSGPILATGTATAA